MDKGQSCYKLLLVLRFVLTCLPQTGYVHPDEHFQYPEIVYGDLLGIQNYKTWEFTCLEPIRSIVFPYLTIGLPAVVLSGITGIIQMESIYYSYLLLILPRLVMCVFSLIHDMCLFKISKLVKVNHIYLLNIFASSYVTLVFYTRTLSNSLEAVFVTLIIYIVSKDLFKTDKISKQNLTHSSKFSNGYLIGIFITVGCFIRPTFLLYAVMPVMFLVWSTYKLSLDMFSFVLQLMSFLPGALITALSFIVIDTVYYNDNLELLMEPLGSLNILQDVVVTPLNFIRYNLDFENVKTHGHHPRYLHILVNLHMLFPILGLYGLIISFKSLKSCFSNKKCDNSILEYFMPACFLLPIILLSVIPHQEPRFIIPVLFPLICMCSRRLIHFFENKIFFTVWLILNIIGTIFMGFFHQGGLTTAMSSFHSDIIQHPTEQDMNILFYHTYMPPRYLLAIPKSQINIHIHDLQGNSDDVLLHTIQNILENTNHHPKIFIVVPGTLNSSIVLVNQVLQPSINFTVHNTFFPHFTTEDPPNFRPIWKTLTATKMKDLFALHVYKN